MNDDRPAPKRVSARPVAYWLVAIPIASAENTQRDGDAGAGAGRSATVTLPLW